MKIGLIGLLLLVTISGYSLTNVTMTNIVTIEETITNVVSVEVEKLVFVTNNITNLYTNNPSIYHSVLISPMVYSDAVGLNFAYGIRLRLSDIYVGPSVEFSTVNDNGINFRLFNVGINLNASYELSISIVKLWGELGIGLNYGVFTLPSITISNIGAVSIHPKIGVNYPIDEKISAGLYVGYNILLTSPALNSITIGANIKY